MFFKKISLKTQRQPKTKSLSPEEAIQSAQHCYNEQYILLNFTFSESQLNI